MQRSDERRQGMRGWVKRHPVASFFVLAYAISWLASVPAALGYGFMFFFTQFGPALAALIVTWYSGASVLGWARRSRSSSCSGARSSCPCFPARWPGSSPRWRS